MNLNDLGTQLLYTSVPVWTENSDESHHTTATGFIINKQAKAGIMPFLITAGHIVERAEKVNFRMTTMENGMPRANYNGVNITLNGSDFKVDKMHDIAVIPIGNMINDLKKQNSPVFFKGISEDIIPTIEQIRKLSAVEDVIIISYLGGNYCLENQSPITRHGITATAIWGEFQKQPKFLIDANILPGSSGSPVFIFNRGSYLSDGNFTIGTRIIFLGILTASVHYQEMNGNSNSNLGLVLKSDIINSFLDSLINTIQLDK